LDSKKLGARIRFAREAKKLSQEDLANQVGKTQKAISQLELGKRGMYVKDLVELANALNTSVTFLLALDESINELDEIDQLIIQELRRVNSQQVKEKLLKILSEAIDLALID
jgi:transcriptional regulator with XRE-family HTH domain